MQQKQRTYSQTSKHAALLLGKLIKLGRKRRRLRVEDLSERAGISRGTLQRIERGDLRCEIGLVFEVAAIVGVRLFETDGPGLGSQIGNIQDKIALLPAQVRQTQQDLDDDF